MSYDLHVGDCRDVLASLPAESARCIVTSPPYFGLRDYGVDGQIGIEDSLDDYLRILVDVFREARRVLSDDGTLWLNLGDSYAGSWGAQSRTGDGDSLSDAKQTAHHPQRKKTGSLTRYPGLKSKDLAGVPWRVAFALQADGWYLRSDIIWHKPNPMPESIRDRPTKAHEYLFLLAKSERYHYSADAIREDTEPYRVKHPDGWDTGPGAHGSYHRDGREKGVTSDEVRSGRNKRTVWTIPPRPFTGAHFATYPPELVAPCILAGSEPGDTILDPFNGAGTTGLVALELGRSYVGIELNPEYAALTRERLRPNQREWKRELEASGLYRLWHPNDWPEIESTLLAQ